MELALDVSYYLTLLLHVAVSILVFVELALDDADCQKRGLKIPDVSILVFVELALDVDGCFGCTRN